MNRDVKILVEKLEKMPHPSYEDSDSDVLSLPGMRNSEGKFVQPEEIESAFVNFRSKGLAICETLRRCLPRKGKEVHPRTKEFWATIHMKVMEVFSEEILNSDKKLSVAYNPNPHNGESLRNGVKRIAKGTVNPNNPLEKWLPKTGYISWAEYDLRVDMYDAFAEWQDGSSKEGREERDTKGLSREEHKEFVENLRKLRLLNGFADELLTRYRLPLTLKPKLTVACPVRGKKN